MEEMIITLTITQKINNFEIHIFEKELKKLLRKKCIN